ncbi:MAG: trehalose-6-phosphate synthase [Candidatus Omnitrophota bacterium]|nr:trehalose-6-phosphate synthase [Candidatus Omnitrophota bacterium]MDZ4242392.1 trehalose-6-phosphate synthase [Candidatus Omnitrophota bacterium]
MWTKTDLQNFIQDKLGDYLFIAVSNRQPYVHVHKKGKVECQRGVGGVISALDPIMQACRGTWVAFGSGDADRSVSGPNGEITVPPHDPSYTLRRIWLTKEEELGYYHGYSNNVLWPLCHLAFQRPLFRQEDWEYYKSVNRKFAKAVIEEIGGRKAFVWIQDYHLCLLPQYLKEMAPKQLITAHFWHVPWPSYEIFRICPQREELLNGLLANDLIGFHIRYHCHNFLDVIDREMESKIDRERFSVVRSGHETLIRPYPISVDFEGIAQRAGSAEVKALEESLRGDYDLAGKKVLIGLDRIDYTKGIPEKILAVDRLLERYPDLRGKLVFLQIGVISRLHTQPYKDLNDQINAMVEDVNWKYSTDSWRPVIFVRDHFSLPKLLALYRISDAALVASLHDGMNLVAKEYVASRTDEGGMLVLSQFTGAARELTDAVLVNPYDREEFCEGIYKALTLSEEDRARRMGKMRETIRTANIYRWAGKIISELLKFEFKE